MSENEIDMGDKMLETRLKEKSAILNISIDELVDRYVKRGLFMDDYYEPPKITAEELLEMSKRDVEKDKERGIFPKKHNFDVFIGRWD